MNIQARVVIIPTKTMSDLTINS